MGFAVPRVHHVLVVDDGPLNRRLTGSMLERLGCTVDLASGGIEAVFKVLSERYDLVLLDLHMGDLDGAAALQKIRAGEAYGDHRTTIWALSSDEPAPDSVCFDGYLTKPTSVDELRAVLASLDGRSYGGEWPSLGDPAKFERSDTEHAFETLSTALGPTELVPASVHINTEASHS